MGRCDLGGSSPPGSTVPGPGASVPEATASSPCCSALALAIALFSTSIPSRGVTDRAARYEGMTNPEVDQDLDRTESEEDNPHSDYDGIRD